MPDATSTEAQTSAYDSDAAFDALMDDLQVLYGLEPGHAVTQEEVDALLRLDAHWRREEENAVEAYHRGYQHGLQTGGGSDVADLRNRLDDKSANLSVERALASATRIRMAEVLEPFATAAAQINPELSDDTPVELTIGRGAVYTLALSSLRAARSAMPVEA